MKYFNRSLIIVFASYLLASCSTIGHINTIDVNYVDQNSDTPLLNVARDDTLNSDIQYKYAKILLARGADVNFKNAETGDTALHIAIKHERFNLAKLLLISRANVNIKNSKGQTVLHNAIRFRDEKTIKIMLPAKNDSGEKRIALDFLIGAGDESIIKTLIAHGADVNSKDNAGKTPLKIACAIKPLLKYFFSSGQMFGNVSYVFEREASHNSLRSFRIEISRDSIRLEKDPHILDEIVKLLISAGADVNVASRESDSLETAIEECSWTGYSEAARLLKNAGACDRPKNITNWDPSDYWKSICDN